MPRTGKGVLRNKEKTLSASWGMILRIIWEDWIQVSTRCVALAVSCSEGVPAQAGISRVANSRLLLQAFMVSYCGLWSTIVRPRMSIKIREHWAKVWRSHERERCISYLGLTWPNKVPIISRSVAVPLLIYCLLRSDRHLNCSVRSWTPLMWHKAKKKGFWKVSRL